MSLRHLRPVRLLPLLVAVLCPLSAGASDLTGFLPEKGHGTVALGFTDESYDEFWRGSQKVSTPGILGEIQTRSTSLWMNWGLTDRLALVVDAAHVDVDSDGTGGMTDSGLQNLTAFLAFRLWESGSGSANHSLVGAVGARTPLESYEANAPVARGDDTTDALLRLVYLLRSGSFYWSQQVGYDLRSDDAPDGIPLYTEVGYTTGRATWIGWYSRHVADSGTDIGQPGFTFPSNEENLERLGAKAVVDFGGGWGAFGGYFTTLDGRNTGNASGFSIGGLRRF